MMMGRTPSMPRPQHIIWDWNGTLLNDADACVEAINLMLHARFLPGITRDHYRDVFGFPVRNYYEAVGFDLHAEDWDALAREYHDHYARTARHCSLQAGAADVLRGLRRHGVRMSILSASERSILVAGIRAHGLDDLFDGVYGLDNLHAASKADRGRELVAALRVPPSQVLLIGDTIHDFEVARTLSCACALVMGGHQSETRLRTCGCPVYPDLPTARRRHPGLDGTEPGR